MQHMAPLEHGVTGVGARFGRNRFMPRSSTGRRRQATGPPPEDGEVLRLFSESGWYTLITGIMKYRQKTQEPLMSFDAPAERSNLGAALLDHVSIRSRISGYWCGQMRVFRRAPGSPGRRVRL